MGRLIDVCAESDLPDAEVAVVTVDGIGRIAVFHAEGGYFGLEDRCSHQQAWLSDGFVEGCTVECPLHAAVFDLRTGRPSAPPATESVRTFAARVDGDRVVLEL